MGLEVIPNQPINLEPYEVDDCNTGDGKQYCTLYNVGDTAYLQWKLTPCGDDLVCDPKFEGLLSGNNLLSNGTFTGASTYWRLYNFTYGSNKVAANSTQSMGYIAQNNLGQLVEGAQYSLTYTISGAAHTNLYAYIDIGTPVALTTTAGTHTTTLTAVLGGSNNSSLIIQAYESTVGAGILITIDTISLVTVTTNSCVTYNTGYYAGGWSADETSLCHVSGSSDSIEIDVPLVDFTDYQQIKITIKDFAGGSIRVYANTTLLSWGLDSNNQTIYDLTGNGIFTTYTNQTSGMTLTITSSYDFQGCIDGVSVYELSIDYSAAITDVNGVLDTDISGDISYSYDRANLVLDTSPYDGCYKIAVLDSCASFTPSPTVVEINSDPSFASSAGWTLTASTGTLTISGGDLVHTIGSSTPCIMQASRAYVFPDGDTLYSYQITVTTGTMTNPFGQDALFAILPNGSGATPQYIQIVADSLLSDNTTYVINGVITVRNGTSGAWHNKFGLYCSDNSSGGSINKISSYSILLSTVPQEGNSYLSNCIAIADEHDCAKLIEGTSNVVGQNYLGFDFQTGNYRLSSRVRFLKFNHTYNIEASDSEHSDGSRRLAGAKREKYYEGLIDHVDENTHDWISAAMLCDYFTIDGVRYYAKPDDYKPEWDKSGTQQVSQARIAVRKRTSTIYKIN